jgi:predicted Zn-dependent protease
MDEEKNRFWIWSAGSAVVLALLAAMVWFGWPHYRHFKERREQAQAQAFLASGDYRNALLSARQTLQLDPTNVPAGRVMAALADLSHNPVALDYLRRVVQSEPSIENKLQLASAALRYQSPPFPLTAQILDELAPAATNRASYQMTAASLAVSLHRLDEAETHFEIASQLEPTNQLYLLNLAIIRLGAVNETKAVPARAVLENLRTDANLGPSALRALVVDRLAHKDFVAANNYSTQLLANAKATLADQLQQLGILQQLKSENFAVRLQAVQRQAATNAAAVAEVAGWMESNHLLADDLRWLTNLPVAQQSQLPVRLALADAYLQSADWWKLRDFVSNGNWEEMDFLRLALLSRAWSRMGASDDSVADDLRGITDFLQGTQQVRQALPKDRLPNTGLASGSDFDVSPTEDSPENDSKVRLNNFRGNSKNQELLQRDLNARADSQLSVARIVAHSSWSSAVTEAGNRYGALTTLLGLAERWKMPREREDLLLHIVEKFPRERWAQQTLEQSYLANGNTAALNELYAGLFSVFPDDADLKNNLAFTCLLLNTNLPKACQWAGEVYAGTTNNPVVASTFAFALHLQGRTKDGLAVLQKLDDRFLQQPDTALYYAVLLAAAGDTNKAAPFLKIARTKTLWLPEEKVLLSKASGEF